MSYELIIVKRVNEVIIIIRLEIYFNIEKGSSLWGNVMHRALVL